MTSELPRPLRKLGFLTIGLFDERNPQPGQESTLQVIELGERLGFDSAWLRHRHLQYGISSPIAILAAASQRTSRIALGTAVIPLGWENPLRLAEDLATVDLLSGGRLNPGVSVGPPMRWDDVKGALYPDTAELEDFSYQRVERLLRMIRGDSVSPFQGTVGIEEFSDRVQPHSTGLIDRVWYGGASLRSAQWAGEHGMNFLTSSVVKAEEAEDFAEIQLSHVRTFRAHHPDGPKARVSQGLVVIPTDRASRAQRAKYERYAPRDWPERQLPKARPACCSPPTWSVRRRRSPTGCWRTPVSRKSTRWRSRCRSPSRTRTTYRSSPTSPPDSVRRSAGDQRRRRAPSAVVSPSPAVGRPGPDDRLVSFRCTRFGRAPLLPLSESPADHAQIGEPAVLLPEPSGGLIPTSEPRSNGSV